MTSVNYSKWDHIEVSDDEDDTHPNIDTPSLFRWRHQSRLERDAAWKQEKSGFEKDLKAHMNKLQLAKTNYEEAKKSNASNISEMELKYKEMMDEDEKWKIRQAEISKKEKLRPLNIDSLCSEGKSKTIINPVSSDIGSSKSETEDDAANRLKTFIEKYDKLIKNFGLLRKPVDSQNFLISNPDLVCEDTANQLVLWCLDLAMEEKFDLMNHVSHQCIVMQFLLELAKSLKRDPRSCVRPFFSKFVNPEPEYDKAFQAELTAFRERIRARAKVKIQEAMERYEEEERQNRIGPGGLDPVEVFESLPKELQLCFESKDVEMLKTVLSKMDPEEAEETMQRCIKSGLWVENANAAEDTTATGDDESIAEENNFKENVEESNSLTTTAASNPTN